MLESALQQRGLGISVHAAPFRNRDNQASVALAIEIDGGRLPLSPPGRLELSFYSVNDQGRAGTGVRKDIDLALKPDTVARVKTHGIRLNPRMALAPGRYQLRFGARESSAGQSGSVFYDLIVPDFQKEELALSGLLLTSVTAQQTPTADPDPLVSKQLPGAATSRRSFPVGDTLAVYAEVYDNNPSRQPRQIDVAVRLIAAQGNDVFTANDSMSTNTGRPGEPPSIYAQFKLEDLDPGTYLLRVEAKVTGGSLPADWPGDPDYRVPLNHYAHARDGLRRRRSAVVLLCASSRAQQAFTLEQLLDRSSAYVEDLVTKFSRVVAEEQYTQEYLIATPEGSRGTFLGAPKVAERRALKSDLLMVKPAGLDQWFIFRDVFEVDARAVRDRENRLAKLFLESRDTVTAIERAHEIATASALFNIRPMGTIDNPMLALGFLQRVYRPRFRFTLRGRDTEAGPDMWILEYRETGSPR